MQRHKQLVHPVAEYWQGVNAKEEKGNQSRYARSVDVVIASEVALESSQATLIPEWSYVEGDRMYQAEQQAQITTPPVQNVQSLVANARQQRH